MLSSLSSGLPLLFSAFVKLRFRENDRELASAKPRFCVNRRLTVRPVDLERLLIGPDFKIDRSEFEFSFSEN